MARNRVIPMGVKVGVNMWRSEAGKGLSYGPFVGVSCESFHPGGWDVVDIRHENGERISVYAFSVYLGRDGGR